MPQSVDILQQLGISGVRITKFNQNAFESSANPSGNKTITPTDILPDGRLSSNVETSRYDNLTVPSGLGFEQREKGGYIVSLQLTLSETGMNQYLKIIAMAKNNTFTAEQKDAITHAIISTHVNPMLREKEKTELRRENLPLMVNSTGEGGRVIYYHCNPIILPHP